MKNLEQMVQIRHHLSTFSQGVNPFTGALIDGTFTEENLKEYFQELVELVEEVIVENGGVIENDLSHMDFPLSDGKGFSITEEEFRAVPISLEPLSLSNFLRTIGVNTEKTTKDIKAITVNNWLVKIGALENGTNAQGKLKRHVTPDGYSLGLQTENRESEDGPYEAILFSAKAQKYILYHLPDIF